MMRVLLGLTAALAITFGFGLDNAANASGVRCFQCGSGSSGSCGAGYRCWGTRDACQKRGCKITASSSTCSKAANVKRCSDSEQSLAAQAADLLRLDDLITDKRNCGKAHDPNKCKACIAGRGKWNLTKKKCNYASFEDAPVALAIITDKSKCGAAHDPNKCKACIAGRGKWDTTKKKCNY